MRQEQKLTDTVRILDRPEVRAHVDELIQAHLASTDQSDILRENDMLTVQYVLRLKEPITHEEAMKLLTECVDVHEVSV